jgi:putative transposase
MPFIKIWIHCVWATKNRSAILNHDVRTNLFSHIAKYASNQGIFIDRINGSNDHLHLLISLGSNQNIARVIQTIKGESSCWMNKSGMLPFQFGWEDDYFAVSVSESQLDTVRAYIDAQVEHHRVKTFADEYQEFIEKFGFADRL